MKLLINPNVHKTTKWSRLEFLERLRCVEAIRTRKKVRYICTYFTPTSPTRNIDVLYDIIRNGNFEWYRPLGGKFIFGMCVSEGLFDLIMNVEKPIFIKQNIMWLAALYLDAPRLQHVMREQLEPFILSEVLRIAEKHGSVVSGDVDYDLLKTICHEECGGIPLDLFSTTHPFSSTDLSKKYYLSDEFYIGLDELYFTDVDWENVVEKGSSDSLSRVESDVENWEKWKHTFRDYERNGSHVYSLINECSMKNGYVYIINQEGSDLYKLGFTENPDVGVRVKSLQTASPQRLLVKGNFAVCAAQSEKRLHSFFSHQRRQGEWFHLSPQDVNDILDESWRAAHFVI